MFTGDLERKTYADVDAFLKESIPEGTRLDYKRKMPDRIERTISAMANSEGGLIVIGVDEERATRTPKLPPDGITLAGQAERVQSKAYQAIHEPITALDIGTYSFPDDGERGVLVVRIHPSERAPHAVDQGRTVLRRVGAQAMKEGRDLDDHMDVDRMGWLFERRTRNQEMIDAALARYESLLLDEPVPDGHYRFDIVAYPAVAHADPLKVEDLRRLTTTFERDLGGEFGYPYLRSVSGGLVEIGNWWSCYFDGTGLTASTLVWDLGTMHGNSPRIDAGGWVNKSLLTLKLVGLASKESGWGSSIHVRARLQGVKGSMLTLFILFRGGSDLHRALPNGNPSLQDEVIATATASVDELAEDPEPCFAEILRKVVEAFGHEMSREYTLSVLRLKA